MIVLAVVIVAAIAWGFYARDQRYWPFQEKGPKPIPVEAAPVEATPGKPI
jgi:hypothetical protein